MITITNKTVGWIIVSIIFIIPFIGWLMSGLPPLFSTDKWYEVFIIIYLILAAIIFLIVLALMLLGDIDFEFNIKLPTKKPSVKDKELFLKLGTLDKNSEEWMKVYEELNAKGKFG